MAVVQKKSVTLNGHRTSISLEPEFWSELRRISESRGISTSQLIAEIDAARIAPLSAPSDAPNLSSAIRVFVLKHFIAENGDR